MLFLRFVFWFFCKCSFFELNWLFYKWNSIHYFIGISIDFSIPQNVFISDISQIVLIAYRVKFYLLVPLLLNGWSLKREEIVFIVVVMVILLFIFQMSFIRFRQNFGKCCNWVIYLHHIKARFVCNLLIVFLGETYSI